MRVPKGYPAIIRRQPPRFKQLLFYVELAPDLATTPGLYTEVVKHLRAVTPFRGVLERTLEREK